jgi:hypothetical protein
VADSVAQRTSGDWAISAVAVTGDGSFHPEQASLRIGRSDERAFRRASQSRCGAAPSPDGSIRPSAISPSARSTLRLDHRLVRRLGVKRCVKCRGVAAPLLPVDPSLTQRLLQSLRIGEAGRVGRILLAENQPNATRTLPIGAEPVPERGRVRDDQGRDIKSRHEQHRLPSETWWGQGGGSACRCWWSLGSGF